MATRRWKHGIWIIIALMLFAPSWANADKIGILLQDSNGTDLGFAYKLKVEHGSTITGGVGTIGSGNLASRSYIIWTNPSRCDEGNATLQTGMASDAYGLCKYSASASYANNYAIYRLPIPPDIDTTQDLKVEQFGIRLDGNDTGIHCYKIDAAVVAPSAAFGPVAASFGSAVNLPFAADAAGKSGDFESVTAITLTGWKSISGIATAGNRLVIRVGRDGGNEAAGCTSGAGSTVASYGAGLVISYVSTQ